MIVSLRIDIESYSNSAPCAAPEVYDHYVEKKDIKDIAFVYGVLAADLITTAGFEGMGDLPVARVSELLNKAESIDKQNEYIWLLGGFLQIQRGKVEIPPRQCPRLNSIDLNHVCVMHLFISRSTRQRRDLLQKNQLPRVSVRRQRRFGEY